MADIKKNPNMKQQGPAQPAQTPETVEFTSEMPGTQRDNVEFIPSTKLEHQIEDQS